MVCDILLVQIYLYRQFISFGTCRWFHWFKRHTTLYLVETVYLSYFVFQMAFHKPVAPELYGVVNKWATSRFQNHIIQQLHFSPVLYSQGGKMWVTATLSDFKLSPVDYMREVITRPPITSCCFYTLSSNSENLFSWFMWFYIVSLFSLRSNSILLSQHALLVAYLMSISCW